MPKGSRKSRRLDQANKPPQMSGKQVSSVSGVPCMDSSEETEMDPACSEQCKRTDVSTSSRVSMSGRSMPDQENFSKEKPDSSNTFDKPRKSDLSHVSMSGRSMPDQENFSKEIPNSSITFDKPRKSDLSRVSMSGRSMPDQENFSKEKPDSSNTFDKPRKSDLSHVSMSGRSMPDQENFSKEIPNSSITFDKPRKSDLSRVSMSGRSMPDQENFSKEKPDSSNTFDKPRKSDLSRVSMSGRSMPDQENFSKEIPNSSITFDKPRKSDLSRVSMSGRSMPDQENFSKEKPDRDQHDRPELPVMDGKAIFKLMEVNGTKLFLSELRRCEKILLHNSTASSESEKEDEGALAPEHRKEAMEGALKIMLHVLKETGNSEYANLLENCVYGELDVCQRKLRQKLKKFEYIYEGASKHCNQTSLNKIYTELYITEGDSGAVNIEHEVRQIEAATRRQATEDKPIKCEDIFKPLLGQDQLIRTVLTKGISGIGKTISVRKFNLDWAEGRVNQDIQLLINLPFRELNLMRERHYTLTQFLHYFLVEAKESGLSDFAKYKLVMIFDGLDECRLPLDFDHNETCQSASEPALVDVLLTNLIKGNLLPSAHIWITSRPAAANRVPARLVDRVTEIRGFNDPQKEEYFRKKISDQDVASRVIAHVKSSRSIHIMCHIPVFSWISATVLQKILEAEMERGEEAGTREMPKTLTQMYTHFVKVNTQVKKLKYSAEEEESVMEDEEMILKLGRLAFEQLMKGNMIFYESELNEYNLNLTGAAVRSGIFTEVSDSDSRLCPERVFSFVHLSMQEFLAAFHVFHTFTCFSQNLLEPEESSMVQPAVRDVTILLKTAVDKALQSNNGHLDLFLRFLLGLSQTSNHTLLKKVLTRMESKQTKEIVEYIKEKIRQNPSPERCINLFHCLSELNDLSLVEEIQTYLNSGQLSETKLSSSQWSALVFVLLTSKDDSADFDMRKYSRSEEGLIRLLPVIKESNVVLLRECNLTGKSCETLATILSSSTCGLKELDLSDNDLKDSGIELLSAALASPTCELEKLRLSSCGITETGCSFLAAALRSNPSHLKQLDLSCNHPGDRGAELFSALQKDIPHLTVSLENNAECYLKSALTKYACELTFDLSSAHSQLEFSEDNKQVTLTETHHSYPDHPNRFTDWGQVLCVEGLSSKCYWEVEWRAQWIGFGVAYKGITRRATSKDSVMGHNDKSWRLRNYDGKYSVCHNNVRVDIPAPYFQSRRVGVFLDWPAGTLSFYAVSPKTMTHLYTYNTEFSEPLYPGFKVASAGDTLALCKPQHRCA
ncbi:uncharacterized protein LOC142995953 isoform X3 [Genypterus blacodes]|uniref:uncharacterized protein LOC142995953 isoform X3 n=1 Tax=Genypterus blacodes TaxID=154954 RepID=UPI003F75B523